MKVEVIYATADRLCEIELELSPDSCVEDAVKEALCSAPFAGVSSASYAAIGVWGELVAPQQPLRDGDRIELLRPLHLDPLERRRRLAKKQRLS